MNKFLLICPINFEDMVLKELKMKELLGHINSYQIIKGGIEIECSLEFGLSLNYHLKTVSRILLRLKEQKCRDFPKLFQIISKLPLHSYLVQESLDFKISTKKSRIINTAKANETAQKAFNKYLNGQKIKSSLLSAHQNSPTQRLYIRIEEDDLVISIDTTGEKSHIRGNKEIQGHAPLRETFATSLLLKVYQDEYQKFNLLDPMCGSATFLTEARDFYKLNNREFIFERWPIVKKIKIDKTNNLDKTQLFKSLQGHDRDISLLKTQEDIKFIQNDFFDGKVLKMEELLIISNPPYGKRIKISGDRVEYFKNYINRLKEINPTGSSYFICPSKIPLKAQPIMSFNNNGIEVTLYRVS